MTSAPNSVTIDQIEAAAARLTAALTPTPFVSSEWLSGATRADVVLKLESVQPTGSFKVRGALNALLALRERDPSARAVVTASAGNHGVALAWAASRLGVDVRVHLPATAPAAKRDALRRWGATLVEAPTYDEAEAAARADAAASGRVWISPYNDADVIAGAGTVALEMIRAQPELDTVLVPIGGGGLASGIAIAAKALSPGIHVIAVEAEASPVFTTAMARGAITTVTVRETLADGLAGNLEPGSSTFDLVRATVDSVAMVNEVELAAAMRGLVVRERLVAEGAGAAGVAALLSGRMATPGRRIGVVITGRNVDWAVLSRVLAEARTS